MAPHPLRDFVGVGGVVGSAVASLVSCWAEQSSLVSLAFNAQHQPSTLTHKICNSYIFIEQ